jgi:hypothetical protein
MTAWIIVVCITQALCILLLDTFSFCPPNRSQELSKIRKNVDEYFEKRDFYNLATESSYDARYAKAVLKKKLALEYNEEKQNKNSRTDKARAKEDNRDALRWIVFSLLIISPAIVIKIATDQLYFLYAFLSCLVFGVIYFLASFLEPLLTKRNRFRVFYHAESHYEEIINEMLVMSERVLNSDDKYNDETYLTLLDYGEFIQEHKRKYHKQSSVCYCLVTTAIWAIVYAAAVVL